MQHRRSTGRRAAKRHAFGRRTVAVVSIAAMLSAVAAASAGTAAAATDPCSAPANPIVAENCQPGTPQSQWDVVGAGDRTIQGFATEFSVNRGTTEHFKVNTDASAYTIDIYRIGYYGGDGARLVATVLPS